MSLIDRDYMYPEREKRMEQIKSLKRIKTAEMNDAVDTGHLVKRKRILNEIIELDYEEDKLKPPLKKEVKTNILPPYLPNSGIVVKKEKKSLLKRILSFFGL